MKYLKLYLCFVKNSVSAQMQFKANFFLSVCTELGFIFAKALYIIVIFSAGYDINGLPPEKMLLFIGSYTLITGIMDAVYYPNMAALPGYVRTGDLDMYLTKPVSPLFIVSFRKFDLGLGVPNVAAGLIMIAASWRLCEIPCTAGSIGGFLFYTLVGCALTYPVLLLPVLLCFWTVKSDSLMSMVWGLWDSNNVPMTVYSRFIQLLGVFVVPIFVITNFGPLYVFGLLPRFYGIYSVLAVFLFGGASLLLWKAALQHYASASS